MIWQFASAVLLIVDSCDRRIVSVLLKPCLFQLLLANRHELSKRALVRVYIPSMRCPEICLGGVAAQAHFKLKTLHTRIRSRLSQVMYL